MTTTIQLYDVFAHDGAYEMRAPLQVIRAVYGLQKEAEQRLLFETTHPGADPLGIDYACRLWNTHRGQITIFKACNALAPLFESYVEHEPVASE
jgi:hypothetical protein